MKRGSYGLLAGIVALLVLSPALLASRAAAGEVEPSFAASLEALAERDPAALADGLLLLSEQLDLPQLEREMATRGITSRWRRHEFVLTRARELAARTQGPLLGELDRLRTTGSVAEAQSYWISNLIAVRGTPSALQTLAARADVGTLYENSPVRLRQGSEVAEEVGPAPHLTSRLDFEETDGGGGPRALEDGLVCINVQSAWDQGLTGAGQLVCTFDTGCDGTHPAFASRWRGNDPGVPWDQAWHDPYTGSQFPFDAQIHGTHVLGILCGAPADTAPIGVAFEAKWISAGILISYNVQKIIDSYQWAADPDGNPSTMEDVPDVINNSWGTGGNCEQTYWNAIDVVEAAGIVNVVSVDNTGPSPGSVNSPESRATTPFNCFSVGNVNPHLPEYPIWNSSGRGPSPCDGSTIKPEVTAPGAQIRSSLPGGGYGNLTGTSMAAPHVSGACTLLMQANPNLTVDQVKECLMVTSYDRGAVGEDNDYGWGIIDVGAALAYAEQTFPPDPPPRNLTAHVFQESKVQLIWQLPSNLPANDPLVGYNVYRAIDAEPYPTEPVASIGFFPTAYVDEPGADGAYRYVVTAIYDSGAESNPSNEAQVVVDITSGVADAAAARRLTLEAGPNPFHDSCELAWSAPTGASSLRVFDASGKRVRELTLGASLSISGRVTWDGHDQAGHALPAGTYFAVLRKGAESARVRLTLVR